MSFVKRCQKVRSFDHTRTAGRGDPRVVAGVGRRGRSRAVGPGLPDEHVQDRRPGLRRIRLRHRLNLAGSARFETMYSYTLETRVATYYTYPNVAFTHWNMWSESIHVIINTSTLIDNICSCVYKTGFDTVSARGDVLEDEHEWPASGLPCLGTLAVETTG